MKKPDGGPLTEPHALNNIDSIKKKKKKNMDFTALRKELLKCSVSQIKTQEGLMP